MTTSRSNLGPLTTSWKYPQHCTSIGIECLTCNQAWQAQTCGTNADNTQGISDDDSCWPPTTAGTLRSGFFSPGLVCPGGYVAACSATHSGSSNYNFDYPLSDNEVAIGCCPTGYICAKSGPQTCESSLMDGASAEFFICTTGWRSSRLLTVGGTYTATNTDEDDEVKTITQSIVTLRAPLFQLVRQATDLPTSTSGTDTFSETATTSTPADNSGGGGLSVGAQAGIGVGVGVLGAVLIGAALSFWRRKRRTSMTPSVSQQPLSEETGKTIIPQQHQLAELDGAHYTREAP